MTDMAALVSSLVQSSHKGVGFLLQQLDNQGNFVNGDAQSDLCTVYKLPMMLLLSGKELLANQVLDNIKAKFMLDNGDFVSYKNKIGRESKTRNNVLSGFWCYMNGWVAMAAHRAGRFDISFPAFHYMKSFFNPQQMLANSSDPYDEGSKGKGQEVGVFMSAHLGLACLYFGDVDLAIKLGDSIVDFVAKQPNSNEFYLRKYADTGNYVIEPSNPELSPFYSIKRTEPNQLYFFLGYPAIFLTKLFLATRNELYMKSAESVLDFLLGCHDTIYSFHFSHKVAYAAALVATETKQEKYKQLCAKICRFLIKIQNSVGDFLHDSPLDDNLDQSAEISLWLQEISVELSRM